MDDEVGKLALRCNLSPLENNYTMSMARPGTDGTDTELVNLSLTGDSAAFGLLVERHKAAVARLLRALFANLAGVEDLVQESFLRAYLDLAATRSRPVWRVGAVDCG